MLMELVINKIIIKEKKYEGKIRWYGMVKD